MRHWLPTILLLCLLMGLSHTELTPLTDFVAKSQEAIDSVWKKPITLKIVLMRHGQSEQNRQRDLLVEKLGSRKAAVKYQIRETDSTNLVDAMLTPKGVEQAKESGEKLSKMYPNIKYVFVSPARRAVETAMTALKYYTPNPSPKVILNPWMRERMETVADAPLLSYEFLAKYPSIDRSILAGSPNLWFADYFLDSPKTSTKPLVKQAISSPDYTKKIMELLVDQDEKLERPSQIALRLNASLNLVKKFVREQARKGVEIKDDEILLVGHGFLFCHLLGYEEILNDDTYGRLIGGDFHNGEFKHFDLIGI